MSRIEGRISKLIVFEQVLTDLSLAHAEIYLTFAIVLRRFDFELFDTDASDIELAHDYFLPYPRMGTKGVRVRVHAASK